MKVEEIQAVRTSVALYDASAFATLRVQGADAAEFLHGLTTNDVKKLPVGQIQAQALLDRKGKVQSFFDLLRISSEAFLILVQEDLKEKTTGLLKKMIFIQELVVTDESSKWAQLWIVGPEAMTVLGEALGLHEDMLPAENKLIIPPDKASWHVWRNLSWAVPRLCLLLPATERPEALELFQALEVLTVAKEALDLVRLELRIPEYGVEIGPDHLLLEANGEGRFVRNKGCYPGQEVIEKICAYGEGKTPYKLVSFYIKGKKQLEDNSIVKNQDGAKVGQIVRTIYDPEQDKTLVAAYVESKYSSESLIV